MNDTPLGTPIILTAKVFAPGGEWEEATIKTTFKGGDSLDYVDDINKYMKESYGKKAEHQKRAKRRSK